MLPDGIAVALAGGCDDGLSSLRSHRLTSRIGAKQLEPETRGSILFEISEIYLPVFRIGNSIRFDETLDDLRLMSDAALPAKDGSPAHLKYYYWDASDRWFQAVNIVKIKRPSLWLRFMGGNDLMIANYQLQLLDERPLEWRRADTTMRDLLAFSPGNANEGRASLHKCDTSLKLVMWLKTHIPRRWPFQGL